MESLYPYTMTRDELIFGFIFLFIIASLTAYYAYKTRRNPLLWFILTLFFSFLAPLFLLLLTAIKPKSSDQPITPPSEPTTTQATPYIEETKILKDDRLWFYLDDNHEQHGPISIFGLKELWNTGSLTHQSLVWAEGMPEWKKVEDLEDMHQSLMTIK